MDPVTQNPYEIPPTLPYNGLHVVSDLINRYDKACAKLHAGPPGDFLFAELRKNGYDPEATSFSTDTFIRPRPGTRKLLLLGRDCAARFLRPNTQPNINTLRGYMHDFAGIEVMATYMPVDCCDIVDHEGYYEDDDDDDNSSNFKDDAPTKRSSFRPWFRADLEKLLSGVRRDKPTGDVMGPLFTPQHNLDILEMMRRWQGQEVFFDIETHPATNTLQCFSVATKNSPVFSVPVYDHNGRAHYSPAKIGAALARMFSRNRVIIHNASFDLGFLAHFHGVPYGDDVYCTMVAHHRMFLEVEKSLAHCIAYWINAPYHKDEAGTFHPYSFNQFKNLCLYNTKDVLTLRAIYYAQQKYLEANPSYRGSVNQGNAIVPIYLTATMTGFEVDVNKNATKRKTLKDELYDITRVLRVLTNNAQFNPASENHICEWLHDGLKYPIDRKTKGGSPSTDAATIYKHIIDHPRNIGLKVLMYFKEKAKIESTLAYKPYFVTETRVNG